MARRVLFPGTSCEAEFCFRGYSITNGVLLARCAAAGNATSQTYVVFFFFARTQSCIHFCALLPTLTTARCSNLAALSPLFCVHTCTLCPPHPSYPPAPSPLTHSLTLSLLSLPRLSLSLKHSHTCSRSLRLQRISSL